MSVNNLCVKPAHLPERLTISFPIWGLFDTDGKGAYADFDAMMREHAERGFNCIRLESGAGLMFDRVGNALPPLRLRDAWGEYNRYVRQSHPFTPGSCDLRGRLIELFTAAKKHGIFIILSSWYFLHTYWFVEDARINEGIYAIPPHERYDAFAQYLHHILHELEVRGLISQLAYAEIFNEADGLPFVGGYNNRCGLSVEERARFREEHERAIAYLKQQHPGILFAYDISAPKADPILAPVNAEVLNFHSYFMWSAYTDFENQPDRWLRKDRVFKQEIIAASNDPARLPQDWIDRVWFYSNLDPARLPDAERELTERFLQDLDRYRDKRDRNLALIRDYMDNVYPNALVVCGEGVSYTGTDALQFEEKCPAYWDLLRETARRYREFGLWGSVVRTCCGPEDPVWYQYPEELLSVNRAFAEV